MATCSSEKCRAEIDWALNHDDSKRMPVTRASVDQPDGTLAVWRDDNGVLRYRNLAADEAPLPLEHRGRSHYKDCADPQRFSKSGPK